MRYGAELMTGGAGGKRHFGTVSYQAQAGGWSTAWFAGQPSKNRVHAYLYEYPTELWSGRGLLPTLALW